MLQTPGRKAEDGEERKSPGTAVSAKELQTVAEFAALKRLNLKVRTGEFVCIIGDVGSGKSSLLSSLIGDLLVLPGSHLEDIGGICVNDDYANKVVLEESRKPAPEPPISITQDVSYVQQVPWIQNKTIRENILFGLPFERRRYNRAIKICELTRDLEILPGGDETEIGEKGINLSGG